MTTRFARSRSPAAPPEPFTAVKLTGTNGKGSVAAMLEAILLADGRRVGLFTSPHLERESERIRIGGAEIDPADLERELAASAGAWPYFDRSLAAARRAFSAARVDVAILEVAIGGYRDPVHLVPGPLAAITSIGADHRDLLGGTQESIAADKAGIASDGSLLVIGPDIEGAPLAAIERDVLPRGVRLRRASLRGLGAEPRGQAGWRVRLRRPGFDLDFDLPLAGRFQLENLATAIELADAMAELGLLRDRRSLAGVARARWPARLELVRGPPDWLLDSAHNEHAFRALARDLPPLLGARRAIALYGASSIEHARECLPHLAAFAREVVLAGGFYRALAPDSYAHLAPPGLRVLGTASSAADGLSAVRSASRAGDVALVLGSLYLAGACRGLLVPRAP